MGMNSYSIENYGLFVPRTTLESIHKDDFDTIIDELTSEHWMMNFTLDDIESSTIHPIDDNGSINYKPDIDTDGYLLPCQKSPKLFNAPYQSRTDIISELKESYSQYLPDNYDYQNNLVYGQYITWG